MVRCNAYHGTNDYLDYLPSNTHVNTLSGSSVQFMSIVRDEKLLKASDWDLLDTKKFQFHFLLRHFNLVINSLILLALKDFNFVSFGYRNTTESQAAND